ncbi:MAG: penicillin acylase family protein [Acidobacteriales bacterium]|nr:penicillin acylase family protein [Terriglobales bacterium]
MATANGRIVPDKYPYSLSVQWEAPWRTDRIYRVLESGKKFSAEDMLQLQNDIYSEFDLFFAERAEQAVDHAAHPSTRVRQAADLLRNWDGRMSADSAAPTVARRAREKFAALLLHAKLKPAGVGAEEYHWGMATVWLENVIRQQPSRWLPAGYASFDDVVVESMRQAVNEKGAPKNLESWRWGESNRIDIAHPIFARVPLLNHLSGPGAEEQSGSEYSVKAVTRHHGPSERMTVDLADLDHSTLNLVTGQSGNLLSPYHDDHWKAWYEGFTFALPFSEKAVNGAQAHRLVLTPGF